MGEKRGQLQVSLTFIVVLTIAMLLLATGLFFLFSLEKSSRQFQQETVAARTTSEITQTLSTEGKKITLFPATLQLKPEEKRIIQLNILNVESKPKELRIQITGKEKKWLTYEENFFSLDKGKSLVIPLVLIIPLDALSGEYPFQVDVYDASGEKYAVPQSFLLIVTDGRKSEEKNKSQTKYEQHPELSSDCAQDFSCDAYFIFVPLGNWISDELFKVKSKEREAFFKEISEFKFKKTGAIIMPLAEVEKCNLQNINKEHANDHLLVKKCADRYADALGITATRIIGLSASYDGGKTFFGQKTVYAGLGFTSGKAIADRPGIVAHELGHSYNLCDEYSFQQYQQQKSYLRYDACKNRYPASCSPQEESCLGNSPTYRDYAGEPVLNVCEGSKHYSVMGFSTGAECGFDTTGGYDAIR